jgi:GNAT superfamily N-acetyltransferase
MTSPPEALDAHHDLSLFDCGKPALNDWLRSYALANQARGFTRVMVVSGDKRVVGFYGLSPTAVASPIVPPKIRTGRPPDPIPCILFGQLAVDLAYAGRGIGSALLRHALERCVDAAERIGGRAVIVRAIDGEAEDYWRSCDFVQSSSDPSLLFRSINDIAAWLGDLTRRRR